MKILFMLLLYLFFGLLYYFWVATLEIKSGQKTRAEALFTSILFWPFLAQNALYGSWNDFGLPKRRDSRTRYADYKEAGRDPQNPGPGYNETVFPGADAAAEKPKDEDFDYAAPDDAAALLDAMKGTEAPLTAETTVTYRPTGVSKTYPAGTPFPSAFLQDWKSGLFTRGS